MAYIIFLIICIVNECLGGLTENVGHKLDRHEIEGQDICSLKDNSITMQNTIVLKQRQHTSHNSKGKLNNMHVKMHQILLKHQVMISYK